MVVQDNVIHLFKSTSMNNIYEKWGKGICEFCDEQLEETELAGHHCSHKAFSMLYLHEGMKDELMVIVYHESAKEENTQKRTQTISQNMYFEKNTHLKEREELTELENNEEYTRVMQKRKKEKNHSEFRDYY